MILATGGEDRAESTTVKGFCSRNIMKSEDQAE